MAQLQYLAKKMGGILIEINIAGIKKIKMLVVGTGLNVNQVNFEWPSAVSIALVKGIIFDSPSLASYFKCTRCLLCSVTRWND